MNLSYLKPSFDSKNLLYNLSFIYILILTIKFNLNMWYIIYSHIIFISGS